VCKFYIILLTKHSCPYFMTEANRHVIEAHNQYVTCKDHDTAVMVSIVLIVKVFDPRLTHPIIKNSY